MAHILIIDDDEQYPKMMAKILKQEGHQVVTAACGDEGLDMIKNQHFELVITDILMPGKDGIDVIASLIRESSKVPVIAISGGRNLLTPEFNLNSAKALGVKGLLKKPFTSEQLFEVVAKALT